MTRSLTFHSKRNLLKLAGIASVGALAALAGCGKKEEPAAPAAPAPASAPASAAAAPKAEPLKIAFAYVGPVGDGGWTFAHDNGRKALEKEFGDKVVTSFVESVPESADAERVLRDLASQGNKLIFGTTFGYMESDAQGGRGQLKGIKFEHATGYKTGREPADLRQPHLRRCVHGRCDCGQHDQEQHARCGRLDANPGSHPQHQQLHAGCPVGQPQDQDQGGLGQ